MSSTSTPRSCAIFFGAISRLAAWFGCRRLSTRRMFCLPVRIDGTGKTTGGGLVSRGHLHQILSNPIYAGRLSHKKQVHEGLHAAIIDPSTWDRVQSQLADHVKGRTSSREDSDALLAGKLFDDRGNRMSPSYAAKGGKRWRYYVSRALLQGRKLDAGSLARVPAAEIEKQVEDAIRSRLSLSTRSIANSNAQPDDSSSSSAGNAKCAIADRRDPALTWRICAASSSASRSAEHHLDRTD